METFSKQDIIDLYNTVARQRLSYAEAMLATKRRFIKGDFGEAYRAPCYWASFIYVGRE